MANATVLREVTPLSSEDCFIYISRTKSEFTYPIHFHPDYELNFIENAKGVKRIVGDSIEEIEDFELVLITGANLEHAWINGNCKSTCIKEITIQFHEDLFMNVLRRNQFRTIREMFEKAKHGLVFPTDTAEKIKPLLLDLGEEQNGFRSFTKLMQLMYELSLETQARILSSSAFSHIDEEIDSRRVKKVLAYLQANYQQDISLADVAELVGMSRGAFCRFIKKRTAKTFVEYLNGVRLGMATRMLIDTTSTVSEICYECGFNNLSHFNRLFKKKKGCTPKEFRDNYSKTRILI
ncbi:MAG: AraC family transcriptional regulator [Prevotellaceae bacterium]|jgi:AraC-like DNA-binding protein|nr:AraC family transcriptional regulator [Prevotellaceae bacterium]